LVLVFPHTFQNLFEDGTRESKAKFVNKIVFVRL